MTAPDDLFFRNPFDHSGTWWGSGYVTASLQRVDNWPVDPGREAWVTSLYFLIQRFDQGSDDPTMETSVAQVRIVTAAHGTETFEVTLPPYSGPKEATLFITDPVPYTLVAGDDIQVWLYNGTFRHGMMFFNFGHNSVDYDTTGGACNAPVHATLSNDPFGDGDFYTLAVGTGVGRITVRTTNATPSDALHDFDLYLYPPGTTFVPGVFNTGYVAQSTNANTGNEFIEYLTTTTGTYTALALPQYSGSPASGPSYDLAFCWFPV